MSKKPSNEQIYYDALKHITQFYSAEKILRDSEKLYGLFGEEALEGAYENIQHIAKSAIKGKRKPKE